MIDTHGGSHGIRDLNLLDSAVNRVRLGYYGDDFIAGAAALLESLGGNHPFIDGNKRVAFSAAGIFLRANGLSIKIDDLEAHQKINSMFETNSFNFENIKQWLHQIVVKINP